MGLGCRAWLPCLYNYSTGIGFITVQNLVRKGAKVYLGARDESKATGALARLEAEGLGPGNGTVEWLKVDLSDPKVAQEAARKFVEKETRLDILSTFLLLAPHWLSVTDVKPSSKQCGTVSKLQTATRSK